MRVTRSALQLRRDHRSVDASMHDTVEERKVIRFKQPLTFKALKEQGLCPT
jgi:hypothetical protein